MQKVDGGWQLMETNQATHCPHYKLGERLSLPSAKLAGGTGKTPSSLVKVVRILYTF